jgi:hypothetical protein
MKTYVTSAVLCVVSFALLASAGYGQGLVMFGFDGYPEYRGDRQGSIWAHGWQDGHSTPSYSGTGGSTPPENRSGLSKKESIRTVLSVRLGNCDLLFIQYIGK